tara:strand:+ start:848 stop:1357 length:510 start_codon:yes stop_codon:yes gene_type:complete
MTVYFADGTNISTAPSSPLFSSYAILWQRESSGTHGGSASTSWSARTLNHEHADPDGIVSLSNSTFTLQAGSYCFRFGGAAYDTSHDLMLRIYNTSDSTEVCWSGPGSGPGYSDGNGWGYGVGRGTISSAKNFQLQQRDDNNRGSHGRGYAHGLGSYEIWATCEIFKEA